MDKKHDEMMIDEKRRISDELLMEISAYINAYYREDEVRHSIAMAPCMEAKAMKLPDFAYRKAAGDVSLEDMLDDIDAGFSETLLALIDRSGKTDAEVYKKAHVDRKLFSKIRNNPEYRPSKATAIAFAIALELDIEEAKDFIGRAGYALSHSSKFDIIIEFYKRQKI